MNSTVLSILVIIISFLIGCRKEKNRICHIYENEHGYTIGTVSKSNSIPTRVTYHYNYELNSISYTGKLKTYGIGQNNNSMIGMSFLVVYELNTPSNSDLNTDFIIEEESDLAELTNQFDEKPPKPDWPKCK